MTLREQLLSIIEIYCALTEQAEASVSTQVFSGGKRIRQIREGGDIGTMGFERAMVWFSERWPESAVWPHDVPRPVLHREAAE